MNSTRWGKRAWDKIEKEGTDKRRRRVTTGQARDFLKASAQVWGEAWGNADYMVTKPGDAQGDDPGLRRAGRAKMPNRKRPGESLEPGTAIVWCAEQIRRTLPPP